MLSSWEFIVAVSSFVPCKVIIVTEMYLVWLGNRAHGNRDGELNNQIAVNLGQDE